MAILKDVRDAIFTITVTAVAAINRQFDISEINKRNWRKWVQEFEEGDSNGLNPPWTVFQEGDTSPFEGGCANTCFSMPMTIYYITSISDGGSPKTPEVYLGEIDDALMAIVEGIKAHNGSVFNAWDFKTDTSEALAPNRYFSDYDQNLWCGAVTCTLVFGESG